MVVVNVVVTYLVFVLFLISAVIYDVILAIAAVIGWPLFTIELVVVYGVACITCFFCYAFNATKQPIIAFNLSFRSLDCLH